MLGGKSKVVLIIAYAGDPRSHNVVAANKTGGCPCRFPLPNFFCYQFPLKEQLNIAILKIPRKNFLINSC
jgi:hypothetical protein